MLPTGYGKSLIYDFFSVLLRKKFNKSAYVIVIEPLNVIINQQLTKLGSDAMAVKNNMSKEELQSLKSSTYIYSHPENIINNEDVRCDPKQSMCNSG